MSDIMKKEAEQYGIPYEKLGRNLVWHDEFDKEKIDTEKWCFDRSMSGADREYDNSEQCCRVENGEILMQVHKNDDPEKPYRLSEGFSTRHCMLFKYGYLEARIRAPYRHGAWPSFWLQSKTPFSKVPWFSEIDIFEIFSSPDTAVCNIHKWDLSSGECLHCSYDGTEGALDRAYRFENPETINDEYHIYGFEWDEEFVSFYIDGVMYKKFNIDPVKGNIHPQVIDGVQGFHDFHFILMNNEIFTPRGGWVVDGWSLKEEDKMPIDYHIDWVRLYQNPKKEEIILRDEIIAKENEVANA